MNMLFVMVTQSADGTNSGSSMSKIRDMCRYLPRHGGAAKRARFFAIFERRGLFQPFDHTCFVIARPLPRLPRERDFTQFMTTFFSMTVPCPPLAQMPCGARLIRLPRTVAPLVQASR